jgi:hypothetical protein
MPKKQKRYVCNGRRELRQESPSQNARAVDRKVTYDQAQSHVHITKPKISVRCAAAGLIKKIHYQD